MIKDLVTRCDELIRKNNVKVATAESCTGGLIAANIVSLAGCSDWFTEGCVTYSNDAKQRRLNVNADTLKEHGAVSPQTAIEMAHGIRTTSGADIGISTTGIAGPGGGSDEKPVGTVYVGYSDKDCDFAMHLLIDGDRNYVRNTATQYALTLLLRMLANRK